MTVPTKIMDLAGSARDATSIRIDLADLRDTIGERIDWQPGDLLVLDFHRPDVVFPAGWQVGQSIRGHAVGACWLTPGMVAATFIVPDAGPTEWDGYVLRGVEPSPVVEGDTA